MRISITSVVLIFVILIYVTPIMYAADLGDSLKKLGILSNMNKPGVVNDQLGGFMTGGSMHTRNRVSNTNILSVDLPSASMGCGGIDLYTGGFGYINSAQLESLIKNIGSNAVSYGSMLAIKTISPQIADILSQLESMARFLNAQNINSCQMGASIASGLWPKNAASQELACQARKMGESATSSYFTARYNCSNSDKAQENKNEYKGLLGTEFNLVFHALRKQNPNLKLEDVEELMSISGTLIVRPGSGGSVKFIHKNSLIKEAKLIEGLIYGEVGEKVLLYKCQDGNDKCLDLTTKELTKKQEDSYIYKITKLVSSIAEKFISEGYGNEQSLSEDEKHLVQTSSVPILKMISLETALKGHNVSISIEEYAEMIAFDYLINYLDSMLDKVYEALSVLEYSQIDGEPIKNFKEEIRFIKSYLASEKQSAFEKMNVLLSVKQRMLHVENMVNAAFADFRDSGL